MMGDGHMMGDGRRVLHQHRCLHLLMEIAHEKEETSYSPQLLSVFVLFFNLQLI